MKTAIGLVLAFALAFSVVPAVANDTFHAFSTLSAMEQASLTPLSNEQLAAVEGAAFRRLPTVNINVAVLPQINVCVACEDVEQRNIGSIRQGIRFRR
jgi:hypothetical protein